MPLAIGTGCDMFEKGSGFHASEEKQYSFMQCMHMFSRMDSPHVVEAFDLSEFDTACDLGGRPYMLTSIYKQQDACVSDMPSTRM